MRLRYENPFQTPGSDGSERGQRAASVIIPAAEGPSIASGLDEPAWRTETAKLFGQFERIADAVSPEGGGAALGDAD